MDAVFSRWGFSWDSLVKKCPKQERSRSACFAIAKKITGNASLFETMMKTRQLPVTQLISAGGGSKKALEKYRQFIAAVVILAAGDYPYIRAFLPGYFDATADAAAAEAAADAAADAAAAEAAEAAAEAAAAAAAPAARAEEDPL